MRTLLGTPDKPGSAYILVIRGIYEDGYLYWNNHKLLYPTWGCLLFPDYGEVFTFRPEIVEPICADERVGDGIHCVFSAEYNQMSDAEILEFVRKEFLEYSEDNDPEIRLSDYGGKTEPFKNLETVLYKIPLSDLECIKKSLYLK